MKRKGFQHLRDDGVPHARVVAEGRRAPRRDVRAAVERAVGRARGREVERAAVGPLPGRHARARRGDARAIQAARGVVGARERAEERSEEEKARNAARHSRAGRRALSVAHAEHKRTSQTVSVTAVSDHWQTASGH